GRGAEGGGGGGGMEGEARRWITDDDACAPSRETGDVAVELRCRAGHDELVAAGQQDMQRDEECFPRAAGDEHFALRIDPDAVLPFELRGDRTAQRIESRPRRVVRLAVVERALRSVAHVVCGGQAEAVAAEIDQPGTTGGRAL